eukprot:870122-Amorphochlora_amoeboformis.AAC.1
MSNLILILIHRDPNENSETQAMRRDGWGQPFFGCHSYRRGDVFAWGENAYGQLGLGDDKYCDFPVKVELRVPTVQLK